MYITYNIIYMYIYIYTYIYVLALHFYGLMQQSTRSCYGECVDLTDSQRQLHLFIKYSKLFR